MKHKLVTQKDPLGCGAACVASTLGISYYKALKLFDNGEQRVKNEANFFCKEICMILNNFGHYYKYKYVKKRLKNRIYISGTIVFIIKSKKYPFGHYLLRVNEGWMDPWINLLKDQNIKDAKAGIRRRLPNRAIYFIQA